MTAPPSPNPAHSLGRLGEHHAARFLERRGWEILARNYRFGRREVDLVARRGRVLAFVEVKTRSGDGFGTPAEAITWRKRREIEAVAAHFLATGGGAEDEVRFDAVGVTVSGGGGRVRVEHLPDAWRPGWP
jgi:putative endonuclease